jgi:Domain of unknown function (DUF4397)
MSKRDLTLAVGLAAALSVGGCSRDRGDADERAVASKTPSGQSTAAPGEAADKRDVALVRVVHAVPGTEVDVLADNNPIATGVSYGKATPYKELPADADNFAIRPADKPDAAPLAENSEMITGGNHYTLVAFPAKGDEKPALQVVTDNIEQPAEGKARVRVINASPDADTVDIHAKGADDALFDDVDFKEATGYENVDPAHTAIEVRAVDGKRIIARPTIDIDPGKSYTIIVTGNRSGKPALNALVIEDQLMAPSGATE